MVEDSVTNLKSQVETVTVLKLVHDPEALLIMGEPAGIQFVQNGLACVAERGMSEVVTERDRLSQILIKAKRS